MKKEIIITIVTIIIIIAGEIICQKSTKKCVDNTINRLLSLKSNILKKNENIKKLRDESENIYNSWKDMSKTLAFYMEHDELEKVDVQIQIITADLEADTPEESISEIEQAIYLLHHIEEKRTLKLKNVF